MLIFRMKVSIIFPVRKCCQLFKVLFTVIVIVLAMLSLTTYTESNPKYMSIEDMYEKEIREDEARIVPGLGELGVAAALTGEEKKLGDQSFSKLAINVQLSDRIAYNRTLKDLRHPACRDVIYDAELPSVSVILIFHNEPYSIVVRTLWSIINSVRRNQPWFQKANVVDRRTGKTVKIGYPNQDPNSPLVYIKEIILVDDNSTSPQLKGKLSYYIRTRLPPDIIQIIRLPKRVGLIKARLIGARRASASALVFLDAHCEVQPDWLRPLLQALQDRLAVLVPIIDIIDEKTFYYSVLDTWFGIGGFEFSGYFYWIDIPPWEKKRRGSEIAPTWSPTMAGGLFAINRLYFFKLGGYDDQMDGWGGENLEMSFRIWQCGGTLETIPCSRVGHVFRTFHPYALPADRDTHGINSARMAEVWMDEYAELFYLYRPDLRNSPKIGDISKRKRLREKLKCKSFQWYLDNVYKEKFVPVRDTRGFGRFKNIATGMCLDSLQADAESQPLSAYPCHATLQPPQLVFFSVRGEIRDEVDCAFVQGQKTRPSNKTKGTTSRPVIASVCNGRSYQKWRRLPTGQMQHIVTRLCLQSTSKKQVRATVCRTKSMELQVWEVEMTEENYFRSSDMPVDAKREMRFKKILSHRRVT